MYWMTLDKPPVALFLPLLLLGCGRPVPAAATRFANVSEAALSQTPICFRPPDASLGLSDRNNAEDVLHLCESAAQREQVLVVPFGTPGCLVATMAFAWNLTGDFEGECVRGALGATCSESAVRHKRVKVTLTRGVGGDVLVESTATIRSTNSAFTAQSYTALCRAAFHDYPRSLRAARFDVEVDD